MAKTRSHGGRRTRRTRRRGQFDGSALKGTLTHAKANLARHGMNVSGGRGEELDRIKASLAEHGMNVSGGRAASAKLCARVENMPSDAAKLWWEDMGCNSANPVAVIEEAKNNNDDSKLSRFICNTMPAEIANNEPKCAGVRTVGGRKGRKSKGRKSRRGRKSKGRKSKGRKSRRGRK